MPGYTQHGLQSAEGSECKIAK